MAIAQVQLVIAQLAHQGIDAEIVVVSTKGDRESQSISVIGEIGAFTNELHHQLIAGAIDVAVHSLKDLPSQVDPRVALTAVPVRASVADVLVSRHDGGLDGLPAGAQVGTGSPRRRAQLLALRPDLQVVPLRGNVDTRIKAVTAMKLDAVILAEAGIQRLGLTDRISHTFDPATFLPAPGQGALAIETRSNDDDAKVIVAPLVDPASMLAVISERACLRALHAGCLAPFGAWGRQIAPSTFRLDAAVVSIDGTVRVDASVTWTSGDSGDPAQQATNAGTATAEQLCRAGADDLLRSVRS